MSELVTVLVVDDDRDIQTFLQATLIAEGFAPLAAYTAAEAINACHHQPDLVVLDLGLPDNDSPQLVRQLRSLTSSPILILSARDHESDKVACLNYGANDYLTKPFGVAEFIARLRVLHRDLAPPAERVLICAEPHLEIDFATHRLYLREQQVPLSKKEFGVLSMLVKAHGGLVTQQRLLQLLWGPTHVENTHYLRIVVSQLRRKLGDDGQKPKLLITEPGVGYRLLG